MSYSDEEKAELLKVWTAPVAGQEWHQKGCPWPDNNCECGGVFHMTDVFVRIYATNLIRLGMAMTTVERLMVDAERGNIRLHLLVAEGSMASPDWAGKLFSPLSRFHIDAKRYAESKAKSPIYVCFDDDQLIIGKDWLDKGLAFMAANPDWGMASAWMITGEVPEGSGFEAGWESSSIGCPYFVRKGILVESSNHGQVEQIINYFPETPIASYDTDLTKVVQSRGYKTGFMRHVRYNHLGSQYSQLGLQLGYGWAG